MFVFVDLRPVSELFDLRLRRSLGGLLSDRVDCGTKVGRLWDSCSSGGSKYSMIYPLLTLLFKHNDIQRFKHY